MYFLRITICRHTAPRQAGVPLRTITVSAESDKRPTKARIARLLAEALPAFQRRKGRSAAAAGIEILPVLEKTPRGWRAWRLGTGNNQPSGFEPPLDGRVGKLNSRGNEFSNRDSGTWECADVEVDHPSESADASRKKS